MSKRALVDTIRTLNYTGISGSYAAVGTPITHMARLICFTNNTAGDLYFTDDTSVNKIFVAKGGFKLFDLTANMNPTVDDSFVLAAQTQWYVKQITSPTSGDVYIEVIYGLPNE